MKARSRRDIRIIIRHPGLVRVGTNLLLVALFLAAFYSVDPGKTSWGLTNIKALKYAPIVAAAASTSCYLVGLRGLPVGWPVVVLGVFSVACVAGGVFTLLVRNVQLMETFVGRGFCAIVFLPAYVVCLLPNEKRHFAVWAARICLMAAVVMIPVLVAWRLGYRIVRVPHIYHISAIYFCAAAGFLVADGRAFVRRVGTLTFALACILTVKLTGFGFAAIIGLVLWRVEASRHARESAVRLMNRRVWVTQALTASAVAASVLAVAYRAYLPGGSREVRLQTYGERVSEFVASPLWGSLFFGSPAMHAGALYVPSHSDVLDLLAFGGVLGTALFIVPAVAGVVQGFRFMKPSVSIEDSLSMFGLLTVLCFLFACAVNPLLLDPRFVTVYWIALGVLLADKATAGRRRMLEARETLVGRSAGVKPSRASHPTLPNHS